MRPHAPRPDESGAALIIALFVSIMALGITLSGTLTLQANRTRTETHFLMEGQVTQAAQSGLTEALNWFRRQETQPVTVFEPRLDTTASPPVVETLDPEIGLVREFQIRGDLWGRYEIWKPWAGDPDAERRELRGHVQIENVGERSLRYDDTSAWLIKSLGFVYQRNDPDIAFDVAPNRVLGTAGLECEISRAFLVLPGLAAISGRMGGPINIHDYCEVLGGTDAAGVYYQSTNGSPNVQGPVTGAPALSPTTLYDDSPESIFGLSEDALRAMADYYVTDEADFPVPVPPLSIVFVDESVSKLRFDVGRPLVGSGILYIKGGIHLKYGNNSDFKGLIYSQSASAMEGPARIKGSVVVQKGLNLGAQGPDKVVIEYSADALSALSSRFENYRLSSAIHDLHGGQR